MRKKLLCFVSTVLLLVSEEVSFSQDIQFTQFYAAPLYLNPAFTGANVCSRVAANYRNQWPGISNAYTSYSFAFDHSLTRVNSGIGFLFTNDVAGTGKLRTTTFSGLYSYETWLTRKVALRAGVKAGGAITAIDFNRLTFGDQIARRNAPTTVEVPPNNNKFYFDVSAGLLLYTKYFWVGSAFDHVTRPNQSLLAGDSKLPIKYSLHAGVNLPVGSGGFRKNKNNESKTSISPAINYRGQEEFDQLDLGFYFNFKPMVLGAWYRGIPVFKKYKPEFINHDAMAFIFGIKVGDFNVGYSYDITISKLVGNSAGAHEISLSYQFCDYYYLKRKSRKRRRKIIIPCAKF